MPETSPQTVSGSRMKIGRWVAQGLGFSVLGLGFRAQGLGLRLYGLGFRAQGLGLRV